MAEQLLGVDFEIHGGGSDLLFPHHENEAAQTGAARGKPLARLWVHNGMVRLGQEKMAKSVGNIFLLHEALAAYGRDALIMYFCSGHYRQPIEFDDARLAAAAVTSRGSGRRAAGSSPGPRPAWSAPLRERSSMHSRTTSTRRWRSPKCSTGSPKQTGRRPATSVTPTCGRCSTCWRWRTCSTRHAGGAGEVLALVDGRAAARRGDWAEADRLRDALRALGWEVRDGPDGPELLPVQ